MMRLQLHQSHSVNLPLLCTPFITGGGSSTASFPAILRQPQSTKKHNASGINYSPCNIKAVTTLPSVSKSTTVKGVITVQVGGALAKGGKGPVANLKQPSFVIELVAAELDLTGKEKETVKANASYKGPNKKSKLYEYECEFEVPKEFGTIGAILVENKYDKEMYMKNIVLDDGDITFICESWIHSKHDNPDKRIFFTTKSYLPSETPEGVKSLREKDLESLRGNGKGERKSFERIYEYDTYNDIGDPDTNSDLARPVLGGDKHPYPRRCRTGREMTSTDPSSESRFPKSFYVPRDEHFSEIKETSFKTRKSNSKLPGAIPMLNSKMDQGFSLFWDIDLLYKERINFSSRYRVLLSRVSGFIIDRVPGFIKDIVPESIKDLVTGFVKDLVGTAETTFQFETPRIKDSDTFSWFRDAEFCRQTLAGLNPYSIQLVTEWPLMSKLDPQVYGPAQSTITEEIVEQEIGGFMTLEQALKQKKLFLLDYHDLLLPYVNKVRELEGTTLYGSRTLMFLTPNGTLRPLAIELTRPKMHGKPQWNHVYTPCWDATGAWLWKLAKTHVLAHDSGYHQLVSHWLRTHCVTEPYIIATNRCLSKVHPIHRLLFPHLRYTMAINALSRVELINAGGIIESCFSLGKYSMQLSSDVYAQLWRFDHEALPADLISRGMAVENPNALHGVKLTIEDYPFAKDGLQLWDAIKQWATAYVNHYYPQPNLVQSDQELQSWWTEIQTIGHADKKHEPWWPQLKTQQDLIQIVSTIMWVSSGHHSAVNFGQYDFAGYFPNHPTISRTKMPNEDQTDDEWESFLKIPEDALLKCYPSQSQAVRVIATLNVLSSHSPDEEYIGGNAEAAWMAEPAIKAAWMAEPTIKAAFEEFSRRLKSLEGDIDSRNNDPNLRNRKGAGLVPYELLKPFSEQGVTGMGVPYSISI